jgi:hypothetical protein
LKASYIKDYLEQIVEKQSYSILKTDSRISFIEVNSDSFSVEIGAFYDSNLINISPSSLNGGYKNLEG